MIGCIGIGGVILVPALVFVAGIAIQIAIPAAMFAYILSGLVASYAFACNRSIDWRMASWSFLGRCSRPVPRRPIRCDPSGCGVRRLRPALSRSRRSTGGIDG